MSFIKKVNSVNMSALNKEAENKTVDMFTVGTKFIFDEQLWEVVDSFVSDNSNMRAIRTTGQDGEDKQVWALSSLMDSLESGEIKLQ